MSGKIFCTNCKHKSFLTDAYGNSRCSKNPFVRENWNRSRFIRDDCRDKNVDNDCIEFEPSIWFRIKRKIFGGTP